MPGDSFFLSKNSSGLLEPGIWYLDGIAVHPSDPAFILGSDEIPISDGYFTTLHYTTLDPDISETDPLSLHLDQTSAQTFTGGALTGSGLLKVTSGLLGLDTSTYLTDIIYDTTPQLGGDLDLNGHNIDFPTTPNISDVIDDDTMATASAVKLATSESIKAYVDSVFGSASFNIDCSGGTSDTYGALSGAVNGVNTVYTTSQAKYVSGTLAVWLNGQLQTQGTGEDWVETSPAAGTFTFATAPLTGDIITVAYQSVTSTAGNADLLDGFHASASPAANQVVVTNSNGTVTLPLQSHCYLRKNGGQVIAKTTWTTIDTWTEDYDTLGEFNNATGIFTAQTAGTYLVLSSVSWANADATNSYYSSIYKNTSTSIGRSRYFPGVATSYLQDSCFVLTELAVNDTLELKVYQDTAGNESVIGSNDTKLTIIKVS